MRRSTSHGLVLLAAAGVLIFAGVTFRVSPGAGAQPADPAPTAVALPFATGVRLKAGQDADVVGANCTLCHTLKPIVTHDGFSKDQWAKEVDKMRQSYGAPVSDADAAKITRYLQTYYSAPPPSAADVLVGAAVSPAPRVATPPASPPPATPVAAASPAPGQPAVTVDLVDIAFQPKSFAIPATTPVVVTLRNTGVALHNFTIDTLHISVDVVPGETKQVTLNAPVGTYEYYCDVPGHKAAGMVGTLTVS